ncbi:MAG: hypothetical protein QF437_04330 [Planctomycetota bacterium]|nr:hypothetical protein [Planctomycetota bacterium]MDP7129688.1 hypothetical protein [Planctomycetota bacterium]MDP7251623.1 hypothetical protein [Planctomycetota bacterium]
MAVTKAKKWFFYGVSFFGLMLVGQLACHVHLWTSLNKIQELQESPEDFSKGAYISGEIGNALSIPFTGSIYRLTDSSGSIWVLTKSDNVSNDEYVAVKGRVQTEFSLDDAGKWKPIFALFKGEEILNELSNPGAVFIEKERQGILKAAFSSVW